MTARQKRLQCETCAVRQVAVCAALEREELPDLEAILQHSNLGSGDALFREGDPASNVYNLTEGCLKLFKLMPDGRRQVTGFLFAGDYIGLADSDVYVCDAEAVTDVTLCRFDRPKLDVLLKQYRNLEQSLLGRARSELAEAQNQILLLGRKTAEERLASFILMLSERTAVSDHADQSNNPINLVMSGRDIGDYLGITTETVSRTFTRLYTSGVLSKAAASAIFINDFDKLRKLADGYKLI